MTRHFTRRDWLRASAVMGCGAFAGKGTRMVLGSDKAVAERLDIGSRRELFVDDALVERLVGKTDYRLHQPTPREVAMVHDGPWEGNNTTYHCVFQDDDRYRMFYVTGNLAAKNDRLETGIESFCYAESDDGILWRKPELGLHAFQRSKVNNIVISRATARCPGGATEDHSQTHGQGAFGVMTHFRTQDAAIRPTDTVTFLTGTLLDGTPFVGMDRIEIVPGHRIPPPATSPAGPTKFFVVDAIADTSFRYDDDGNPLGSFAVDAARDARGIASSGELHVLC